MKQSKSTENPFVNICRKSWGKSSKTIISIVEKVFIMLLQCSYMYFGKSLENLQKLSKKSFLHCFW